MVDDSTREIPLTGGTVALVDAADYECLMQWKWRCTKRGYAARSRGKNDGPGSETIFMHRVINQTPPGFETDHINGLTLDNRRLNLRTSTRAENAQNLHLKPSQPHPSGMIPLEEAESIKGFPRRATLRIWCKAGLVKGEEVLKGSRSTWRVCPESVRAYLAKDKPEDGQFEKLRAQWEREQANGFHTGKPISKRGVEANTYGMYKFWECLMGPYIPKADKPKDFKIRIGAMSQVTPENLRIALSNIPVDYKNKTCHYAIRDQMYKAFCSFSHFMIRNGIMSPSALEDVKKLKPRRVFPPRKTVLREDAFEKLLAVNDGMKISRLDFDICLTRTIIMLAAMSGLRREELINLELKHLDLKERELLVYDGKGHKHRKVGIVADLGRQLEEWLKARPRTKCPKLLVSKLGTPLDKGGIHRRVKRMAENANLQISLHGLRRSFATINTEKGMPVPIAQKLLGHSDVKTTMGYIMIDEQAAVDFLKD